ncbi:NAD(P)-dependent oxidoreductase, partial [Streptomyces olivaceus]
NAVDPDAPTVAGIAAAVDAVMGAETEDVLVDGPPPAGPVGDTPWSVPAPVVCDMSAAEHQLGYRPVARYAENLAETVAFIEERLAGRDWRGAYPEMFRAYGDLFDYAAEDAWFAARRG